MTNRAVVISTWPIIGIWETDSLDEEAVAKDREVLDALLNDLPRSVTTIRIEVTIHGRRWTFRQIGPRYILVGISS